MNMEYIEQLKSLRTDNDTKQEVIARHIGISQKQYSRYETGKNELPLRYLIKICKFYNVSADYILGLPKGLNWPR